MMTLVHENIEEKFNLDENKTYQLVIENPSFMRSVLNDLVMQSEYGSEGKFSLYNELNSIGLKNNIEVITNYFSLDYANKKFSTALSKRISSLTTDETVFKLLEKCNKSVIDLFDKMNDLLPINIDFNNSLSVLDYTKAASVTPLKTYTNEIEKLDEYLKLVAELLKTNIVIIVNLSQLFTESELSLLIKNIKYNKMSLILIEGKKSNCPLIDKTIIIDNDLCEI